MCLFQLHWNIPDLLEHLIKVCLFLLHWNIRDLLDHLTDICLFQLHWNNPNLLDHLTDSSGMTIYYTPNLRKYDAELFMFGQEYLKIPPMTKSITYDATCPSDCTVDMFQQNVFITRAVNHMHYLGTFKNILQYVSCSFVIDYGIPHRT